MEAYYIKNNDGSFYIGRVVKKWKAIDIESNKNVEWLSIVNNKTGENIFNWPKHKLNADQISNDTLVNLGLINVKKSKKSFLCKIFCIY